MLPNCWSVFQVGVAVKPTMVTFACLPELLMSFRRNSWTSSRVESPASPSSPPASTPSTADIDLPEVEPCASSMRTAKLLPDPSNVPGLR